MTQQTATNTSVSTQPDPLVVRQDSSDNSGVVTLTLNNSKQFNALSVALLTALQKELDEIEKNKSIRVVVIAAEGKAFCAGHNLQKKCAPILIESFIRRCLTSVVK